MHARREQEDLRDAAARLGVSLPARPSPGPARASGFPVVRRSPSLECAAGAVPLPAVANRPATKVVHAADRLKRGQRRSRRAGGSSFHGFFDFSLSHQTSSSF
jgi:hypothetical protein